MWGHALLSFHWLLSLGIRSSMFIHCLRWQSLCCGDWAVVHPVRTHFLPQPPIWWWTTGFHPYTELSQLLLQLLGAQTALCIPISIPVEMQAQVGLLDCTGKSVLVPALHRGSMKSYSHCSASVLFSLYPYQNQHQLPSTLPVVLKGALSRSNLPGKRRRIFLCKQ